MPLLPKRVRGFPAVSRSSLPARVGGLALAGLLAAAVSLPVHAAREEAPLLLDAAANAAELAPGVFKLSDPAALKDLRKVAIASFQVEFVTKNSASASTSGFASTGRATQNSYYSLVGVGQGDFQAITDKLYLDFVRDFEQLGVEVVPIARILQAPSYQKMASAGAASPYVKGGGSASSVVLTPQGLAVYGLGMLSTEKGGGVLGALAGLSAVGSMVSNWSDGVELQKELGDARLVNVRLVMQFAELSSNTTGFLGRLASDAVVSGKINVALAPSLSMVTVQAPSTTSTLTLERGLAFGAEAIGQVKRANSTETNVGNVVGALMNLAIGGGHSVSAQEWEAVADPAQYRSAVGAGLGKAREMIVARLRQAQ